MHLTILAHPFLIGSSSFLQVARTTIQPLIILNFGQVLTGIAELAALELLEKSHRLRLMGAQWFSDRVLDLRLRGRGFKPHLRHCVVVLEQDTFILA